jgi:hypothetical protein
MGTNGVQSVIARRNMVCKENSRPYKKDLQPKSEFATAEIDYAYVPDHKQFAGPEESGLGSATPCEPS